MAVDWDSYRLHRAQVVAEQGQYVGLLDENCEPLMDCPPVVSMIAPQTKNAPTSLRMQLAVRALDGSVHPICDELVAQGLSTARGQWLELDAEGKELSTSLDASRYVLVEREGMRRVYQVTHVAAEAGRELPSLIEINGVDLLKKLALVPCFSAPTTVSGKWTTFTRDWAGPENVGVRFSKPRDLQDFKLVTVADGVTVDGDAEAVIRRLVSESLQATWKAMGPEVVKAPPMVVDPTPTGLESPYILIRPTDQSVLDEVSAQAMAAGVVLDVGLWLPGDNAVEGLTLDTPTMVVRVQQTLEVE
ncbi:hypothetical protein [Corynebacterium hesseae]